MIGSKARGRFDYASPPKKWEGEHDLTGPRSLVCIAGELRERERARQEARRRAWEARHRPGWLRRAGLWLGNILRRPDRAQTGPRAKAWEERGRPCPGCGCKLVDWPLPLCETCAPEAAAVARGEAPPIASVWEALTQAQVLARRAGHRELADALHCLFLLDLTGNLGEMAPLVASVRSSLQSALGDDPGAVN